MLPPLPPLSLSDPKPAVASAPAVSEPSESFARSLRDAVSDQPSRTPVEAPETDDSPSPAKADTTPADAPTPADSEGGTAPGAAETTPDDVETPNETPADADGETRVDAGGETRVDAGGETSSWIAPIVRDGAEPASSSARTTEPVAQPASSATPRLDSVARNNAGDAGTASPDTATPSAQSGPAASPTGLRAPVPGSETPGVNAAPATTTREPVVVASPEPARRPAPTPGPGTMTTASPQTQVAVTETTDPSGRQPESRGGEADTGSRDWQRFAGLRQPTNVTPALGRAEQVEQTIQVETLTGQTPTTEIGGRATNGRITPIGTMSVDGGAASADSPPPGSPLESRFAARVMRGLTAMVNQRGGTMTMRLDPPELGQLRIQMSLQAGVVSAKFVAEQGQARTLLDQNLGTLRTALEGSGLTVERLSVQSGQSSADGSETNARSDGEHDAGDGASRGRREHDGERGSRHFPAEDFAGLMEATAFAGDVS